MSVRDAEVKVEEIKTTHDTRLCRRRTPDGLEQQWEIVEHGEERKHGEERLASAASRASIGEERERKQRAISEVPRPNRKDRDEHGKDDEAGDDGGRVPRFLVTTPSEC